MATKNLQKIIIISAFYFRFIEFYFRFNLFYIKLTQFIKIVVLFHGPYNSSIILGLLNQSCPSVPLFHYCSPVSNSQKGSAVKVNPFHPAQSRSSNFSISPYARLFWLYNLPFLDVEALRIGVCPCHCIWGPALRSSSFSNRYLSVLVHNCYVVLFFEDRQLIFIILEKPHVSAP